jgi:hypothetical protein
MVRYGYNGALPVAVDEAKEDLITLQLNMKRHHEKFYGYIKIEEDTEKYYARL